MATKEYYEWNGNEWKVAGELETSKFIFKDFAGLNPIPMDNTMFPFLKINMEASQGIKESGYCYIKNNLLPFFAGFNFAALMKNDYAYQEDGKTLFNNEDGVTVTGVVRVNKIEDINDTDDIKNGQNPKKIITSDAIGTHGETIIYEKKVGGYLFGGYQYAGLDFKSIESPEGHFGLDSDYAVKGFGFAERKPIVLWQNFYNMKDPSTENFGFKIDNDYLYIKEKETWLKSVYVGEGSHLCLYIKKQNVYIPKMFVKASGDLFIGDDSAGSSGSLDVRRYSVTGNGDGRIHIAIPYATEWGKGLDYGEPQSIEIDSNIYQTKLNQIESYDFKTAIWDATTYTKQIKNEEEILTIGKEHVFSTKNLNNTVFGKTFEETYENYRRYATGMYIIVDDFNGNSHGEYYNEFACIPNYQDCKFVQSRPFIFAQIKIFPSSLSFLPHLKAGITKEKQYNYYIAYNEFSGWNKSTTYAEYSYEITPNYDWGLYLKTSLIEGNEKNEWKQNIRTRGDIRPNSNTKHNYQIITDKDGKTTKTVVASDYWSNGTQSTGFFYGLRQNSNENNVLGDRFCITLEWDD